MDHKDIEDMFDHLRRIKGRGDLDSHKIDQIEGLEMMLRFLRTIMKYYHVLLPNSSVKITNIPQLIGESLHSIFEGNTGECEAKLFVERLVSQLLSLIEGNTSLRCNYVLNGSYLLGYMDCLSANLNDVLMFLNKFCRDMHEVIPKLSRLLKQVKIVQKKMGFLRYLYDTKIYGYVDHEKLECLETIIQFMADNVGQSCHAFWAILAGGEDDDESDQIVEGDILVDIMSKPPYLLCQIVLVQLEMKKIFLGELNASNFSQSRTFKTQKLPKGFSHHLHSLLVHLRKEKLESFPNKVSARNIEVSIELLGFLVDVPNHVNNDKMLNEVLEKIGALVGDVLYVIRKLLPNSTIKDDFGKINLCSIEILEKTQNLKALVERYYKSFKFTPSKFPTVGGLNFLDSLLRKLNEMLKSESALDFKIIPQIGILERELSSLTSVFRDAAKVQHEHEVLKDLRKRTINLAYEAEIAIDSIISQYNVLWHHICSLPTILKEIKQISAKVTERWPENLPLKPFSAVNPSEHLRTQYSNPMNDDEEVVGFEKDKQGLIRHLIRRKDWLDVLPIVGMAGKGKTTFARNLYNDCMVVSHFDSRAWCCITQTYDRRDLLQEIFNQVSGSHNKIEKVDELADMLRRVLIGKRYLIVLDDIWDVMVWDDLKLSFPNGEHGSRIVVTTRLAKVGEHVKQRTDPYFLPFLTPELSWELLQRKVFQREGCPPELQDVSREVAKRCNGLPLVVVLMAGIIKRNKMKESWWHEVKNALFSYLGESEEYSLSTMRLSYYNLPYYLRPCLLYMGMFKEDARVPVQKLISLWIAEGFVQNIEFGRLEETAEGYLMDLISCNVVMVSRRRYDGKVKYCQVHDVVHHFCLEKCREEKFIMEMKGHFQPLYKKKTRVRFHVDGDTSYELSNADLLGNGTRGFFNQPIRSLITTGESNSFWSNLLPHVSKFGLLKVLDLSSNWVFCTVSSATFHPLIHLKYLSFSADGFIFHPESHLRYLETLLVGNVLDFVVSPIIFWKMEKLRHVEIGYRHAIFEFGNNKPRILEESSILENLRILRGMTFTVDDVDSIDVLLRRCPNLQDLGISISCNEDSVEICTSSLKFESLSQLHSLRMSFNGGNVVVSELYLPSNLKKLVLDGPHIVNMVSLIAGIASLEYLELCDLRSELEEWCFRNITLHKLKFLKLISGGISSWDASGECFPQLETLVIKWCDNLEEIPLSFADIQTLKQIKLIRCKNESLEASALKIKEEVEAIEGYDRIDLIIEKASLASG